jgi:hypothetical protein
MTSELAIPGHKYPPSRSDPVGVPGPIAGAGLPVIGVWWPAPLMATTAEAELSFQHMSFAAVSDCPTIAIFEYTR